VAPRTGCSCDILATTGDQAYVGYDKESATSGNRWVSAVNKTKRKVVQYKGNYVYTPYSSSSGGHTENIEKVWPAASPAGWLKATCDPRDDVPENPNTTWKETFSAGTVTSALKPYTGDIGTVKKFKDYSRGKSGRVTTVRVVGGQGSAVVEGWDIRNALGLNDSRFFVNKNLNITGRIRNKYDAIDCAPGKSKSNKIGVDGGRFQKFNKGRIYVNDAADKVVWLRGNVLDKYIDVGAHNSKLGLPRKYVKLANGAKGVFDGGTIVCNPGCTVNYD
jgi:SpoIID/LytB domain protein